MMKFLNWNIQSGGGTRIDKICTYLIEKNPDVIILTEVRKNKNLEFLLDSLNSIGIKHYSSPTIDNKSVNTSFIASRFPIIEIELNINDIELSKRLTAININGITVTGIFCNKPSTYAGLLSFLKKQSFIQQKFLLAGDLYFGAIGSNLNNYQKLKPLTNIGLFDLWRFSKGDIVEWSHHNAGGGKSQPDHFFSSFDITKQIINIEYDTNPLKDKVSDHAPMSLTLRNIKQS